MGRHLEEDTELRGFVLYSYNGKDNSMYTDEKDPVGREDW